MNEPLVSVCIPNYNYGRYLENCFESLLKQTYGNFEIIFRDNASTDNSMEIAYKYQKKFEERGIYFSVTRNKRNVGSDLNSNLCIGSTEGKYLYVLASDDAIAPQFIEKCVKVFVENPSVGMVMTHRCEMDDQGNIYNTPPFYNKSCVIPGDEQAAVFMMAGIAIPGQRMIKRGAVSQVSNFSARYQVAGDWFMNYRYTCTNDIAYINEPLCMYRVHMGNETSESELNLMGVFEHYKLINHFRDIAREFEQEKALERYDAAVRKLGSMCMRYTGTMIKLGKLDIAWQYMNLALVFDEQLKFDDKYNKLLQIISLPEEEAKECFLEGNFEVQRTISYDPPEGYVEIEV